MARAKQLKLIAKIVAGVLGAIAAIVTIADYVEPKPQGDVAFECAYVESLDASEPEYFTIATKNQKAFSILHWKSEHFTEGGYPP